MSAESEAPPAAPLPELRDFPDRLPPVLVKELRQGLRGKMFVAGFCLLHGLLAISCLDVTHGTTAFFWLCLTLMFIFLLPSRNLGALGEERQEKTLDTLILTRLTPWRIVWGKWTATASLAALTAISVLPYLLMRYLSAGTPFLQEALAVGVLFLCFGALAAVFTAASIVRSPIIRNGFAVAASIAVFAWVASPFVSRMTDPELASLSSGRLAQQFLTLLLLSLWLTFYFLWQAAGSIAPLTANTAAPRRLITLVAFLAALGLLLLTSRRDIMLSTIILVGAGLTELGEKQPPEHIPFLWRGPFRPAAALFLAPGWASGFFFTSLLCALHSIAHLAFRVESGGLFDALAFSGISRWPVSQLIPVLCAPVVFRLLLPASMRWGAAPLFLLAVVSHFTGLLLMDLFNDPELLPVFLPTLQPFAITSGWEAPALWTLLAALCALPALKSHLRRIRASAGV